MGVRKLLDFFFDKKELKILDDILPEFKRHEKLDQEDEIKLQVREGGGEGGRKQTNKKCAPTNVGTTKKKKKTITTFLPPTTTTTTTTG